MTIELNDRESIELDQRVIQIAARINCGFFPSFDDWKESAGSRFRVCEPAAVTNSRVVFETQMAGPRFAVSVHEQRPDGPVRESLLAYAKETHRVLGELYGNDRITVKTSNWP